MRHSLKTWPSYWKAIASGEKRFELRDCSERDLSVDDTLYLHMWDPSKRMYLDEDGVPCEDEEYARTLYARVTYVLQGRFGLPSNLCVMSLDDVKEIGAP